MSVQVEPCLIAWVKKNYKNKCIENYLLKNILFVIFSHLLCLIKANDIWEMSYHMGYYPESRNEHQGNVSLVEDLL